MSDLVKKDDSGIVDIIHAAGASIDIPKPFEREIYLFTTHIAGTTHIDNIKQIEKTLKVGDKVQFFREENRYDKKAIRVETMKKEKLGYVPREDNVIFARLMDAGKELFAMLKTIDVVEEWVRVEMDIYLKD